MNEFKYRLSLTQHISFKNYILAAVLCPDERNAAGNSEKVAHHCPKLYIDPLQA